jgi:hypothetical protein
MIGLLPASGRAARLHGLPKFALPTLSGETLLARHVRLLDGHVDRVRVCTSPQWAGLVSDLVGNVDVWVIPPTTMNDALKRMADRDTDYLIGMPDTYFTGPSPYGPLSELDSPIGIALWRCPARLVGRVGQVNLVDGRVAGIVDKDPHCPFEWMWGALRLNAPVIDELDSNAAHPGIDLPRLLGMFRHATARIDGDYIDCGTPAGIREMLTQEAQWPSPTATHR